MFKPNHLNPGDRVAIVSLSSGVLGEEFAQHQIELGVNALQSFGLEAVFMPNALKGIDYLKAHPEARSADLKTAFVDESIKGIICAIGGDDTFRTIPYLLDDAEFIELVKVHPKLFTGFSDTTINHLMFYKLGMVSYYGPNFLNDLAELAGEMLPYSKDTFNQFFQNPHQYEIKSSNLWYEEREDFSKTAVGTNRKSHIEKRGYEVLRGSGKIEGRLLGGCLESLYDLVVGVRYADEKTINESYQLFPTLEEWQDKILFFETSEEQPNPVSFRKMLNLLKEMGIFSAVNGIVVGKPQNEVFYEEYKKVLLEVTQEFQLPILYNVNFGHAYPHAIIPYGLQAEIDLDTQRFIITESLFN